MKIKKMGFLYGRIASHLPEEYSTPARYTLAARSPMTGLTQAVLELKRRGIENEELENEITSFYDDIDPDDVSLTLDIEKQGQWMIGYYQGRAEILLPRKGENKLKFYREKAGLSQKELAEKVSVSNKYISKLETENQNINQIYAKTVAKIADVLGVKVEDILEESEENNE